MERRIVLHFCYINFNLLKLMLVTNTLFILIVHVVLVHLCISPMLSSSHSPWAHYRAAVLEFSGIGMTVPMSWSDPIDID